MTSWAGGPTVIAVLRPLLSLLTPPHPPLYRTSYHTITAAHVKIRYNRELKSEVWRVKCRFTF